MKSFRLYVWKRQLCLAYILSNLKEVHIIHDFAKDFYGLELKVIILGYIRPELDYTSRREFLHEPAPYSIVLILLQKI